MPRKTTQHPTEHPREGTSSSKPLQPRHRPWMHTAPGQRVKVKTTQEQCKRKGWQQQDMYCPLRHAPGCGPQSLRNSCKAACLRAAAAATASCSISSSEWPRWHTGPEWWTGCDDGAAVVLLPLLPLLLLLWSGGGSPTIACSCARWAAVRAGSCSSSSAANAVTFCGVGFSTQACRCRACTRGI